MVANPEQMIRAIYERFGLEVSSAYAEVLWQETIASHQYQSRHDYSLQETGLTRKQITSRFRPVFNRFGFDTREPEKGDNVVQTLREKGSRVTEKRWKRRRAAAT
jgi:hypothetical protein